MRPTYDQFINGASGASSYIDQIAVAWFESRGGEPGPKDYAHFFFAMFQEEKSIAWVLWDIGDRQGPEPGTAPPGPGPVPIQPVGVDLNAWPRRGASHAAGLLDTRWDYRGFAQMMGGIFGGRWTTRVNVTSASWRESSPHFAWPFTRLDDGRFDLYRWNPAFFEDRLPRFIETTNRYGGVPIFTIFDLYSFSGRKDVSADHHQDLDWPRHNVNGIRWERDDTFLNQLPDPWLTELIERVLAVARNVGVIAVEPFNEGPEKPIHMEIAEIVKRMWPACLVQANRNEDTPGQYQNMDVGEGHIDQIAFHGWKNLGFLTKDFSPKPQELAADPVKAAKRPWTFQEFFENEFHNGRRAGFEFSRVCCSSDGARTSNDPSNPYDYPELLKVFRFVANKGGSIEHQSRSKLSPGARLEMVETDFLRQIANL